MQCGMPGLVAILPICHSRSYSLSLNHSLPPSLCPCPSITEALPLSPTLQNLLPGSNWDAPFSCSDESYISRRLDLFFVSVFQRSLPSSPVLAVYGELSHQFLFPPLASTSSYVNPQTPVTAHRCPQGPLSLLQMSSTMEHECFKQPHNWAAAPCPIAAQDSKK